MFFVIKITGAKTTIVKNGHFESLPKAWAYAVKDLELGEYRITIKSKGDKL